MHDAIAVVVGRFQIVHNAHLALLRAALSLAPRVVVVLGSAHRARDTQNPFTWSERKQQLEAALSAGELARVSFAPVRDYFDDERWNAAVRRAVAPFAQASSVTLVGFRKDRSSAYLSHFPDWTLHEIEPTSAISATDLRRIYFEASDMSVALTMIGDHVAPGVLAYLDAWARLPEYRRCADEHRAVMASRAKYTQPFSLTADSVLTCASHVLLIKRGGDIGRGLWACPGGFIEQHEQFYTAALRELAEETGFTALPSRMKSALRGHAIFDHPARSARGRIVTVAFHFDLGATPLPEVEGRDDAARARWVPIAELPQLEDQLFEDHASILDHFVGLFPQ